MLAAHEIHGLEMGEARGLDLAAIGLVGAVGDQIDAEFALRRLDRGIDLAGRHLVALGIELEVVDQRFHRALHLAALGRHHLAVERGDRAAAIRRQQLVAALLHDAHRLAHLFHADVVAVEAVTVLADGDVEFHLLVALVGLRLAQIPRRAGAAHHHAREAPFPAGFEIDHADIDVALLEDAVVAEQAFEVVADLEERIAPFGDVVDQRDRDVLVHAAGTDIGRVHARAAGPLVEDHQLLALLEAPERRRQRADVHRLRGDVQEMREDAADLGIEHADELAAARHGHADEALDRERIGMLLVHRRDIVEPVEIGHGLEVGLGLDQFLGAAMQQADMRIDALDDLAVELQHEAQHAVRGRVLRAEIDREIADIVLGHDRPSCCAWKRAITSAPVSRGRSPAKA